MSEPDAASLIDATVTSLADDVAVVRVRGEVDTYTSPLLGQAIDEAFGSGIRRLLIDLNGVLFFGTAGIAQLDRSRSQALGAGVELVLVCSNTLVLRPMELMGMLQLFAITTSTQAALQANRNECA